jgi:imidazoleglycerol-phosphate dehydratase
MSGFIKAGGDFPHHVIEDCGICFGEALKNALKQQESLMIVRHGFGKVPFAGSLAEVAIDISFRPNVELDFEDFDNKDLGGIAQHFFESLAYCAGIDIWGYTKTIGKINSDHHKIEAFCRAFGIAFFQASRRI